MHTRHIEQHINAYLNEKDNFKILFIWGPRRSGKTTIMKKLSEQLKSPLFNFDLLSDQEKFQPNREDLKKIASDCPTILIDEVQNHPLAANVLKILFDEFKVKIIATGSSELRQKTNDFESLAGRFIEYYCLPFSLQEIKNNSSIKTYEEKEFYQSLSKKIQLFGAYPEIYSQIADETKKIDALQNILDTYVLKDIINIYDLRNTKLAKDILTKIALQIGQEVSLREIASDLSANVTTISNYVEIFIKNYILLPLPAFKTNLRRAISAHRKFYFLDLGLRNILVKDFRPLELRPDKGSVFENFILSEIHKKILNDRLHYSLYFYREYGGKEVDVVVEDYYKNYICLEVKYNNSSVGQSIFPLSHKFNAINTQNYFELIKTIFVSQ